ncbi:hypothetical protein WOLCODRAFT_157940 [Wolfiporia cocos MD-104 SS10]|uniref:Uncharacterized protein n=1 Tax=Wolfiporia cocos (strain MD-104) TaxID=742152 RepID=A0A2H3JES1_WOLCO|nr:hypothetical protein WOLCODRAFT_157940 [Wolfiporia cocos MD-104 SS10]
MPGAGPRVFRLGLAQRGGTAISAHLRLMLGQATLLQTTTARRHHPPHQLGPAALPRVNNQDRRRIETTQPRDQAKHEQSATANPQAAEWCGPASLAGPHKGSSRRRKATSQRPRSQPRPRAPASLRQDAKAACGPQGQTEPDAHPVAIATATKPTQGQGLGVHRRNSKPRHCKTANTAKQGPAKGSTQRRHSTAPQLPGRTAAPSALPTVPLPSAAPTALHTKARSRQAARQGNGEPPPSEGDPSRVDTGISHATQRKDRAGKPSGNAIRQPAARPQVKALGHRQARRPLRGGPAKANDNRRRSRYRHHDRPRHAYTDTTSREARC